MLKRYVYKNVNKRPVNIGGYQFKGEQELESDILINGFNEAVSNGFLELTERKPEGAEPEATRAPQTGDTGKAKVIFHMGLDAENKEVLKEVEIGPNTLVEFPGVDLREGEAFEGWFKDAEFTKPVNIDKAKSPKEGELHLYAKFNIIQKEDTPPENLAPNVSITPNAGAGSTEVTLPSLPPPPAGNESAVIGSENK
jgi:uncharacterized repeat protein (TIGR02543 family)